MAKCAYCGAETTLFFNDTPLCLDCDQDLNTGRTPQRKPNQNEEPAKAETQQKAS